MESILLHVLQACRYLRRSVSLTKTVAVLTAIAFMTSSVIGPAVYAARTPSAGIAQTIKDSLNAFQLPYSLGRVTDAKYLGSKKVVVAIQDLHCHPEVQRNISGILGILDEKYGKQQQFKVLVEGGMGPIDTSWLNKIPDQKVRANAVEALMNAGRLTGAEYYSIQTKKYNLLQGLEDEKPYFENLARLTRIMDTRGDFANRIGEFKTALAEVTNIYYTAGNRRLDKVAARREARTLDSEKYYKILLKLAAREHVALYNYPATANFMEVMAQQQRLSYKKVNTQLTAFLETLKGTLPFNVYNQLLEKASRPNGIEEVYVTLAKVAPGMDISRYPELAKFFRFVEINQKMNPVDLVREERALLGELRGRLSRSRAEREVAFMADFLQYVQSYYENRMSADDYDYYTRYAQSFYEMWGRYADARLLPSLNQYKDLFGKFYETNIDRNRIFMEKIGADTSAASSSQQAAATVEENIFLMNTQLSLAEPDAEVAVVVTGGFHTQGLAQMLEEQGISYVVITPSVTGNVEFAQRMYDLFARELSGQAVAQGKISRTIASRPANPSVDSYQLWLAASAGASLSPEALVQDADRKALQTAVVTLAIQGKPAADIAEMLREQNTAENLKTITDLLTISEEDESIVFTGENGIFVKVVVADNETEAVVTTGNINKKEDDTEPGSSVQPTNNIPVTVKQVEERSSERPVELTLRWTQKYVADPLERFLLRFKWIDTGLRGTFVAIAIAGVEFIPSIFGPLFAKWHYDAVVEDEPAKFKRRQQIQAAKISIVHAEREIKRNRQKIRDAKKQLRTKKDRTARKELQAAIEKSNNNIDAYSNSITENLKTSGISRRAVRKPTVVLTEAEAQSLRSGSIQLARYSAVAMALTLTMIPLLALGQNIWAIALLVISVFPFGMNMSKHVTNIRSANWSVFLGQQTGFDPSTMLQQMRDPNNDIERLVDILYGVPDDEMPKDITKRTDSAIFSRLLRFEKRFNTDSYVAKIDSEIQDLLGQADNALKKHKNKIDYYEVCRLALKAIDNLESTYGSSLVRRSAIVNLQETLQQVQTDDAFKTLVTNAPRALLQHVMFNSGITVWDSLDLIDLEKKLTLLYLKRSLVQLLADHLELKGHHSISTQFTLKNDVDNALVRDSLIALKMPVQGQPLEGKKYIVSIAQLHALLLGVCAEIEKLSLGPVAPRGTGVTAQNDTSGRRGSNGPLNHWSSYNLGRRIWGFLPNFKELPVTPKQAKAKAGTDSATAGKTIRPRLSQDRLTELILTPFVLLWDLPRHAWELLTNQNNAVLEVFGKGLILITTFLFFLDIIPGQEPLFAVAATIIATVLLIDINNPVRKFLFKFKEWEDYFREKAIRYPPTMLDLIPMTMGMITHADYEKLNTDPNNQDGKNYNSDFVVVWLFGDNKYFLTPMGQRLSSQNIGKTRTEQDYRPAMMGTPKMWVIARAEYEKYISDPENQVVMYSKSDPVVVWRIGDDTHFETPMGHPLPSKNAVEPNMLREGQRLNRDDAKRIFAAVTILSLVLLNVIALHLMMPDYVWWGAYAVYGILHFVNNYFFPPLTYDGTPRPRQHGQNAFLRDLDGPLLRSMTFDEFRAWALARKSASSDDAEIQLIDNFLSESETQNLQYELLYKDTWQQKAEDGFQSRWKEFQRNYFQIWARSRLAEIRTLLENPLEPEYAAALRREEKIIGEPRALEDFEFTVFQTAYSVYVFSALSNMATAQAYARMRINIQKRMLYWGSSVDTKPQQELPTLTEEYSELAEILAEMERVRNNDKFSMITKIDKMKKLMDNLLEWDTNNAAVPKTAYAAANTPGAGIGAAGTLATPGPLVFPVPAAGRDLDVEIRDLFDEQVRLRLRENESRRGKDVERENDQLVAFQKKVNQGYVAAMQSLQRWYNEQSLNRAIDESLAESKKLENLEKRFKTAMSSTWPREKTSPDSWRQVIADITFPRFGNGKVFPGTLKIDPSVQMLIYSIEQLLRHNGDRRMLVRQMSGQDRDPFLAVLQDEVKMLEEYLKALLATKNNPPDIEVYNSKTTIILNWYIENAQMLTRAYGVADAIVVRAAPLKVDSPPVAIPLSGRGRNINALAERVRFELNKWSKKDSPWHHSVSGLSFPEPADHQQLNILQQNIWDLIVLNTNRRRSVRDSDILMNEYARLDAYWNFIAKLIVKIDIQQEEKDTYFKMTETLLDWYRTYAPDLADAYGDISIGALRKDINDRLSRNDRFIKRMPDNRVLRAEKTMLQGMAARLQTAKNVEEIKACENDLYTWYASNANLLAKAYGEGDFEPIAKLFAFLRAALPGRWRAAAAAAATSAVASSMDAYPALRGGVFVEIQPNITEDAINAAAGIAGGEGGHFVLFGSVTAEEANGYEFADPSSNDPQVSNLLKRTVDTPQGSVTVVAWVRKGTEKDAELATQAVTIADIWRGDLNVARKFNPALEDERILDGMNGIRLSAITLHFMSPDGSALKALLAGNSAIPPVFKAAGADDGTAPVAHDGILWEAAESDYSNILMYMNERAERKHGAYMPAVATVGAISAEIRNAKDVDDVVSTQEILNAKINRIDTIFMHVRPDTLNDPLVLQSIRQARARLQLEGLRLAFYVNVENAPAAIGDAGFKEMALGAGPIVYVNRNDAGLIKEIRSKLLSSNADAIVLVEGAETNDPLTVVTDGKNISENGYVLVTRDNLASVDDYLQGVALQKGPLRTANMIILDPELYLELQSFNVDRDIRGSLTQRLRSLVDRFRSQRASGLEHAHATGRDDGMRGEPELAYLFGKATPDISTAIVEGLNDARKNEELRSLVKDYRAAITVYRASGSQDKANAAEALKRAIEKLQENLSKVGFITYDGEIFTDAAYANIAYMAGFVEGALEQHFAQAEILDDKGKPVELSPAAKDKLGRARLELWLLQGTANPQDNAWEQLTDDFKTEISDPKATTPHVQETIGRILLQGTDPKTSEIRRKIALSAVIKLLGAKGERDQAPPVIDLVGPVAAEAIKSLLSAA